ncbi:unnamed protein product [Paramecium primaurelia]|uniref:Uncharacterized protein n=1 Tax=Paramecium primaurelia TaxID=5886 RepID=A0A8S1PLD1_PARPR|nr:unnamed protein product [Paramecium primaurelia]
MIFHKYKRCLHLAFAIKHLISASLSKNPHLIAISAALIIVLFLLFKSERLVWKYIRISLLLELCFYDAPFTPSIVATLQSKITHKWLLLIFYSIRISAMNAFNFQIIDWVYFSIQFVALFIYLCEKERKPFQRNSQLINRNQNYLNMGLMIESVELYDILNRIPCGICLLDSNLQVVSSNNKVRKYVVSQIETNLQQAVFLMIQKAYLQSQQINSFRKNEKHKSIFESLDEQSDIPIKRLQSFCQQRRTTLQQKTTNVSNVSDIAQIIQKHKIKNLEETKLNVLKFKDTNTGKTFEIRIYDITNGCMIVIENITNFEYQQDMQERYRFYSKLINSFSHELRTPLNCSLQLLQILDQNLKGELNDQYLKPALISNKKLLHQINDILDYANFEAQTFKLRPQLFKLSTITKTIEDYFRAECEQKQITLTISSCDDTYISSDYDRIMQILVNLMNNSVKYTKQQGEIHFVVQRAGSIYQFEVFDTGCGIPVEKLYLITKILKNCELDWSRRGDEDYMQYVGLGLKVSSQIARKLCDTGDLSIFSSVNQYTKSKFYVKDMKQYLDQMIEPTEDHIQEPYKSIGRIKCQCVNVLICDDIPFNHLALSTVLKYFNVRVDNAYDGFMAIEMVKQKVSKCKCGYKLIFMDIDMPEMDGCQATKEILQVFSQHQIQCVVIMCSAYDSKENIDYAMKCGMKEILPKPVDTNLLKKILQKYYF